MKNMAYWKAKVGIGDRDPYTKKDKDFLKEQREERVHAMDYLTKTPVGPRATVKPIDREKFEKENKIEHDVGAKMDEYPPKFFHLDIKNKKK